MQGETACFAGESSGQGEDALSECFGGNHRPLTQPDARGQTGQIMGHGLDGQQGGVGGKAVRWQVIEAHAVL